MTDPQGVPVGVCRYCLHPEHPSGTMCSMHLDLLKERMEPYAFTGEPEDKIPQVPDDLVLMHTRYSGCTAEEKCELIERIAKLEADLSAAQNKIEEIKSYQFNFEHATKIEREEAQKTIERLTDVKALANRVCEEIPEHWEIQLAMENGAGYWMLLYHGEIIPFEDVCSVDDAFELQPIKMLAYATRSHNQQAGDAKQSE